MLPPLLDSVNRKKDRAMLAYLHISPRVIAVEEGYSIESLGVAAVVSRTFVLRRIFRGRVTPPELLGNS